MLWPSSIFYFHLGSGAVPNQMKIQGTAALVVKVDLGRVHGEGLLPLGLKWPFYTSSIFALREFTLPVEEELVG